jgi:hypothetical protein
MEPMTELHSGVHHYETVEIKNSKGGIILPGGLETPNNGELMVTISKQSTLKLIRYQELILR